jgi:hypothetical protein
MYGEMGFFADAALILMVTISWAKLFKLRRIKHKYLIG